MVRRTGWRLLRTAAPIAAILLLAPGPAFADAIAVIVNKSSPVDELSMGELRRIYTGQKIRWADGSTIMVVNRPSASAIREAFYHLVLDALPSQEFYQKGSPIPFTTLIQESDVATRRLVARIPNAIGYISLNEVDDTVKVVAIQGGRPTRGSPAPLGYPLQW